MTASRWATLIAGALLAIVGPQSLGFFGGGPTVFAPLSVVLVLPLIVGVPMAVVMALPSAFFWVWAFQLFDGHPEIPKRTVIFHWVVAFLSFGWFLLGWQLGVQYEGLQFVVVTATISVSFASTIAILVVHNRRAKSFAASLAVHWLLFAWIVTFAFPYLGETP